jgi:hypothetical protein
MDGWTSNAAVVAVGALQAMGGLRKGRGQADSAGMGMGWVPGGQAAGVKGQAEVGLALKPTAVAPPAWRHYMT